MSHNKHKLDRASKLIHTALVQARLFTEWLEDLHPLTQVRLTSDTNEVLREGAEVAEAMATILRDAADQIEDQTNEG